MKIVHNSVTDGKDQSLLPRETGELFNKYGDLLDRAVSVKIGEL